MVNGVVPPRTAVWLPAALVCALMALPACDNGPQTAASIELSFPTPSLFLGQSMQITPTVKDQSGKTLLNRVVLYETSAPTVATVTSSGIVHAVGLGSAVITATVDGKTAGLSVVVTPVPVASIAMSHPSATVQAATTLQLAATPLDSVGNALSGRPIGWESSNPSVATVTNAGLVSALAPGTATIRATTEGKIGRTEITVTPASIASIEVTPTALTIREGNTQQLTATAKDAAGRVLTGRTFNWISSDVTKATVSATGLVTGVAPGVASILVTSGNTFGGASVLVVAVVVGSVRVSPDTAAIAQGGTVRLTATVRDSAGTVLPTKRVTWSSADVGIALVDSTGLVTGIAHGTARIIAASGSKADTAAITVVGPPLGTITLLPTPAWLGLERSGRFQITVRDAAGDITQSPVTWRVSDPAIASVDETGLVTALAVGSTVVHASAGGVDGAANLVVTATTVATLSVVAGTTTMTPGGVVALTVTLRDGGGNVLTSRLVSFSSSDTAVATVDGSGAVHGIAVGSARITVTAEGVTSTIDFTVH